MEAVCLTVDLCFLKRKGPLEVIRNNAGLAMIPKASGHRGTGLGRRRQRVLDESDVCWGRMA